MRFLHVLLCITLHVVVAIADDANSKLQCNCRAKTSARIVGGTPVGETTFPWYVSIGDLIFNETFRSSEEYIQNGHTRKSQLFTPSPLLLFLLLFILCDL